jgi:hypothetical protein
MVDDLFGYTFAELDALTRGKVSDLFKIDIEALIEYFDKIRFHVEYIKRNINKLQGGIDYLESVAWDLLTIIILLERRILKYRNDDRKAWSYYLKIQKYQEDIWNLIKKLKEVVSTTNLYGPDMEFIYRYLDEIKIKAQEAIDLIKRAIDVRAFE